MRGHVDHQTATWQLMHFTRCDGVCGLEGHAVQGGHVEHRFGGHARTLHRTARLQEDAGFPAAPHQEKSRQARASGSQQGLEDTLAHFTMEESAAGFKKMLAPQLRGIQQSRGSTSE